MNIVECERCGEEYPQNWGCCPFCETGERPTLGHFRGNDEDN
jgi:hypothetical protein